MKEDTQAASVQSVDRALLLLDILKREPDGCGITELANRMNVAKSTVHRLLTSLWKGGYVKQQNESERYVLGLKCLELAETVTERLDVRQVAKPFLKQLAERTQETVHLVTLEGNEIVYIEKIESETTIRMYSRVGKRGPLYCTGAGKAVLAYLPEDQREKLYAGMSFHACTDATITNTVDLEKHLEIIRERGAAFDEQEHEEGIHCAAAPVFDHSGTVIAAVSAAGPVFRMKEEKFSRSAEEVKQTAAAISGEMGYTPD